MVILMVIHASDILLIPKIKVTIPQKDSAKSRSNYKLIYRPFCALIYIRALFIPPMLTMASLIETIKTVEKRYLQHLLKPTNTYDITLMYP